MSRDYDVLELFRLWHTDMRTEEIAVTLGLTRSRLQAAVARHKLPRRTVSAEDMTKGRVVDPTPEEIEAACEEVRKTWSEEEERRRRGAVRPWRAPTYRSLA